MLSLAMRPHAVMGDGTLARRTVFIKNSQRVDRDTLARDLSTLVARDVRLFYAYSGATHGYYNHAGQLRNALADIELGDHLHEQFLPSADHTFSRNAERMRLIEAVIAWLQSGWPVAE